MTLRRAFNLDGSEISLVQNRLNVAALALTALVFSGGFTLSLFAALRDDDSGDPRREFLHILVGLALGVITSLASIACFLQSQQSKDWERPTREVEVGAHTAPGKRPSPRWYHSRQWWFCLGQLFLYIALAQAMSASLTEVVYGASQGSDVLGRVLGFAALPVWVTLLFLGPIVFLHRMQPYQDTLEKWALGLIYIVLLALALGLAAKAYSVRGRIPFWHSALEQLYQPLTWHESWR